MSARTLLMTADAVGGVWRYAVELATALRPLGWETKLALLGPPRDAALAAPGIELIETGLPLDWLAADEAAVRAAVATVAELAAATGADLVQLNQPALAVAAMPVPVVTVAHSCVATWWQAVRGGALPDDFAWQTRLVREGLLAATRIACPSTAFADALRQSYRLPRAPVVVHNGRSARTFAPTPMHDCVLTAGRLWDAGKDAATLDRAAARLGVPFNAAGPLVAPHGEAFRPAHLHPLGLIDEAALDACLAARPIFASAARYEPFGLAVLEAAQAGCALVLSDIPTFRELWGEVASFVAPGDDRAFAAAIDRLTGDANARIAAGERARAHAARYTPAAMAAGMDRLYRAALGDASARVTA